MMIDKTIDQYFADWESHVFGYGYGTGEVYTIPLLKSFMSCLPERGPYDHEELTKAFGGATTWLLINTLCNADIFEYGCSPRFAWLTGKGERLREYLHSKTKEELWSVLGGDNDYCSPNSCNCGPNGYEEGRVCNNPFFVEK